MYGLAEGDGYAEGVVEGVGLTYCAEYEEPYCAYGIEADAEGVGVVYGSGAAEAYAEVAYGL